MALTDDRQTLPVFLKHAVGSELALKNRLLAFDYLRNLSDQGDVTLQETCILTWAQIARYVKLKAVLSLLILEYTVP